MNPDENRDATIKRIVLPSGKRIEVLRPAEAGPTQGGDASPAQPAAEPARAPERRTLVESGEPHICPECDSSLVYPVAWESAGDDRWSVELRCPNCERTESAVLGLEIAEHFDEELERGAETLMSDLSRLTEANMLADLARLQAALEVDGLMPMDF